MVEQEEKTAPQKLVCRSNMQLIHNLLNVNDRLYGSMVDLGVQGKSIDEAYAVNSSLFIVWMAYFWKTVLLESRRIYH